MKKRLIPSAHEYNAVVFTTQSENEPCDENSGRSETGICEEASACTYHKLGGDQDSDNRQGEPLAPKLAKTRPGGETTREEPVMVTEVCIDDRTYLALIDIGCSRSAIEQTVADQVGDQLVLQKKEATFKQADKSTGKTTHVATAPLKLPVFSTSRVCTHVFRVVPQLLYPVMLGKDFFTAQGIDLLFSSREMEWDVVRVPGATPGLRPCQADTESCRVEILVVDTGEHVNYENRIDARRLSETEFLVVLEFLMEFSDALSGNQLVATKKELRRRVELDILSPDNPSPWVSPAFTFLKKDGSIVFCTEALLQRRFFPSPVIPEILREFQRCNYISVFDLPMGYYARVLAKCSRSATAIVFPWGKYVFKRLPMGVSTAPYEFQAVVNETLGDLEFVWFYLDDFIVMSATFEKNMQHLRVGSRSTPRKLKLRADSVSYLGYRISTSGIKPLHDKVSAIQAITPPRTRRQLRRFIGMVNYYRDMWPRRAQMLAPLTALMSPQSKYHWSAAHQAAFEKM
ncbi:putative retroelement [Phytophthora palmivora]|uniref:Retroelement n=1 Tax=Phytophthora palmivora TaxID=4796 RepID=A0A2P4XAQ3_9STRA|nr:putative retroelement [Phytophthora palmivora]